MIRRVIHVSKSRIKANREEGVNLPPIIFRAYDDGELLAETTCREALIVSGCGKAAARVVYRPDNPLPDDVTCWIELLSGTKIDTDTLFPWEEE